MLQRLTNPNNPAYAGFKTLGITLDRRWIEFKAFLEDMGPRPPGLVLRRKNLNMGFSKDNCYWGPHPVPRPFSSTTAKLANRISRKLAPSSGKKRYGRPKSLRSLRAQALAKGLSPQLVYNRVRAGWSKWNALNVPAVRKTKRKTILEGGEGELGPEHFGGGPPPEGAQGSSRSREACETAQAIGRARALVGREQGEATQAAVIQGEPPLDLGEIEKLSDGRTRMVVFLSLKTDRGLRTCLQVLTYCKWNLSQALEKFDEIKKELDFASQDPLGEAPGASDQVRDEGAAGGGFTGVGGVSGGGIDGEDVSGGGIETPSDDAHSAPVS